MKKSTHLSILLFLLLTSCSRRTLVNQSAAVVSIVTEDSAGRPVGNGTGFWVASDGKLISNWHVIEGAESAYIKAPNGARYEITGILRNDPRNDLVVLQSSARGTPFLQISRTKPSPGERVTVIGSPLGLEQTITDGLVSQRREAGATGQILQISAPISPGSSGSPVFCHGKVVGIAVSKANAGEGIGFCIPSNYAADLMEAINPAEIKPLGEGVIFARGLTKTLRLAKRSWKQLPPEASYSDSFEAITKKKEHKFPQVITLYRTALSPDRIRGLRRLSDYEYYEFFKTSDYYVLQMKFDFSDCWVLSRESFDSATVTNANFDLQAVLDDTRYQISSLCQ